MLGEALRGIGNPNTWVIASAGPLEYAQQGLFAKAFCDALRRPTTGAFPATLSAWTPSCRPSTTRIRAPSSRPGSSRPRAGSAGIPPFFPNPAYQPGLAGLTVADQQHWLSRVRGGPEESTTGFYLTGKTGRLSGREDLAAWMTDPGPQGPGRGHRQPGHRQVGPAGPAGVADRTVPARGTCCVPPSPAP